jgi:polysaccharide biosynthesis/export protein
VLVPDSRRGLQPGRSLSLTRLLGSQPRCRQHVQLKGALAVALLICGTSTELAWAGSNPDSSLTRDQVPFQPGQGTGSSNPTPVRLSITEVYADLYVLGPGDGLQLTFLDPAAKEIGGPFGILPDGTSSLPLLGSVQLTGLTIGQASRWLSSLYGKQLKRPQLYLTLITPRPVKVSIIGEVEKPGLYPLPPFSTPVSAIQQAGGITVNSDIRKVTLRRQAGIDGSQKQATLDISQVLLNGNQLQNPVLFDGDTLIIGFTKEVPADIREIGASNLAPTAISVTILGEVKSPGSVSLPANTPLVEAIFRAGGPVRWRANKNQVELVRFSRDGKATRQTFSYNDTTNLSQKNPPLRNGDTVIVKSSLYGKVLDVFSDIAVPIGAASSAANLVNTWNYYGRNWNNNNNNN